jgi:phage terminase large subunit-like protein
MRDYLAIADQYAADVLSGSLVAGEYIRLACERYLNDKQRALTDPNFDYRLDVGRANHACQFIELMPHVKAYAGAPVGGLGCLVMSPWQVFATVNLFGWVNEIGIRRFIFAYIEVAKKNGKSTWLAAICLYMATADGEQGPEVYTVATNYDQAKIVWQDAKTMLTLSPRLAAGFAAHTTIYDIRFDRNNGVFKPLATDKGGSKDGYNIHFGAIDELHAHKDSLTYDIIANGIASRSQPMIIAITTAGTDITGVAYRERTAVTQVLTKQAEHDRYFGMIFCLDRGDDWRDHNNWGKANPNLGASVQMSYLSDKYKKVELSPSAEYEFRQKSLNEWVGVRNAWIDLNQWSALGDDQLREADFVNKPSFGGLDLASRLDLAGYAKLYASKPDGSSKIHWTVFAHEYINSRAAENAAQRLAQAAANRSRETGNAMYQQWADAGWLTVTDGNTTDYDVIERDLLESHAQSAFNELAFDNYYASQLTSHLSDAGVSVVDVPFKANPISEAMRWLESLIADGRLHHDGNPVLSWCMGNVMVKPDGANMIFPRKNSAEDKIDAAVALILAAARARLWDSDDVFDGQQSSKDRAMADYLNNFLSIKR